MEVRFFLASLAIVNLVVCFSSIGKVSSTKYSVNVQKDVKIPMRDGVNLMVICGERPACYGEIYRPDASGRFPALMLLRYYQTGADQATYFAQHGYACVLVDSRGRGGSSGEWDPYRNEPRDGYDAQQWIGKQNWCSGKIGMFGQSYNAFTQTMSAPLGSQYLKCLFPIEGQQTNFGHLYNDGVPQLNVMFTFGLFATGKTGLQTHIPIRDPHFRQLPLASAADNVDNPMVICGDKPACQAQRIKTWLKHDRYDEYWKSYGVKEKYDKIKWTEAVLCR